MLSRYRIGDRILVKTEDGEYEGTIKKITTEGRSVLLDDVKIFSTQKPLFGIQTFFSGEILSCEVLNAGKKADELFKKIEQPVLPPIPYGVKQKIHDDDHLTSSEEDEDEQQEEYLKEGQIEWSKLIGNENYNKVKRYLPPKFLVLDEINDQFFQSVKLIKQERIVGVHLEGCRLGRSGELHWLSISTQHTVFLIDVLRLRKSVFDQGIRDILESEELTKVFHDCKFPSDILFHKHSVKLAKGIVDTEAADIIRYIRDSKHKVLPDTSQSLFQSLKYYLHFTSFPLDCAAPSSWRIRPLTADLRSVAMCNVVFLIPLWEAISRYLQRDLIEAVEINLEYIRNSTEVDLPLRMAKPGILPTKMNKLVSNQARYLHNLENYGSRVGELVNSKKQVFAENESQSKKISEPDHCDRTFEVKRPQLLFGRGRCFGDSAFRSTNQINHLNPDVIDRKPTTCATTRDIPKKISSTAADTLNSAGSSPYSSSQDESQNQTSPKENEQAIRYYVPKFSQRTSTKLKLIPAGMERK